MKTKLLTYDQLMNPLLRALTALGGSGSVEEIYNKVVELEHCSDEILACLHDPEKSNDTEVRYRLEERILDIDVMTKTQGLFLILELFQKEFRSASTPG